MNKWVNIGLGVAAVLLSGCSGGGNDAKSSCQSIGSSTNYVVIGGGSVTNIQAVGDGNLSTFASYNAQSAGGYLDSQGNQFTGGSNAGVFLTPPPGTSASDIHGEYFHKRRHRHDRDGNRRDADDHQDGQ